MKPLDFSKFEKLKVSGSLPSPKGVALAIMRLTQKEDASMAELARIIKPDPAFVGRLIKAANSVNANPGRPVVSVQEALVVLGMPAVRNLALGFSLLSQYKQGACKEFDYANFWSASLACGIALQALTLRTRAAPAEEAFSVGLLARIGELALATLFAEEYSAVLQARMKDAQADLIALERERFAMHHRELSAAMLADWGLPKIYCDSVQGHEIPDAGVFPEDSREDALLQSLALSRLIADICMAETARRAAFLPRLFLLGARLAIGEAELKALCDDIVREWQEWASLLSVSVPAVPGFEALAQSRQPAPLAARTAAPTEEPPRLCVLVADEDAAHRAAVCAMLEQNGYATLAAANGQEALRAALEGEPHMLVVGRAMTVMSGTALIRSLRDTRRGRALYILQLAAPGDDDRLVEGLDSGADDFLAEPLNQRLLLARLRAGQRIVRMHRELERDREELRRFAADLAVSNRQLQEAALTDALTGVPNRRYAMDRIQQEWAAGSRSGRPLACMVIDLDQFKQVNDAHGHGAGDAYLTQVAGSLRGALRAQDVVCRTGGDEFLVICPDTSLQAALSCAERLRRAVEQNPVDLGSQRLTACMSIGVAVREAAMPDADTLIKRADEGAYLAKQQGRNRVATLQSATTP